MAKPLNLLNFADLFAKFREFAKARESPPMLAPSRFEANQLVRAIMINILHITQYKSRYFRMMT